MTNPIANTGAAAQPGASADLDDLRQEIDAIDRQIVQLLAQRLDRVQKVIAIKQARHLPVYHPAREENLISQRREQARSIGLDPDHVEELYRSIMRQSRVRQTIHVARTGVRPGAKVLLVGGAGQMGRYFAHWFNESGCQVRILDIEDWPRASELCAGIDLAFICVPIQTVCDVVKKLAPFLPPNCLLADITSVKQQPLETMLAVHPGPVLGLHPLFGPSTSSMDKQVVAAAPGRDAEACQWLLDQLIAWGNVVLTIDAREHDDLMAMVQAVRHFATFTFGQFMHRRNIDVARTLEFSSPIYRLELGMVGRFFAQEPSLYANIIFASPERRALLKDFIASMADNQQLIETGDAKMFCDEFNKIADWFGSFCEQSMRESTFLIDKLVERF